MSRLVIWKGKLESSASLLVIVIINTIRSLTKQMEGMCPRLEELSFSLCSSTQMYMIIVYFIPKLSSSDVIIRKVYRQELQTQLENSKKMNM